MSILTGCICFKCKKWHSHVSKIKERYYCLKCAREVGGERKIKKEI